MDKEELKKELNKIIENIETTETLRAIKYLLIGMIYKQKNR